jgi:hypothetical protein
VVDVASELKVLIVEGERGIGPLAGSGVFLQLALAPISENGTNMTAGHARTSSYVAPELISDLELGNKILGDQQPFLFDFNPKGSLHPLLSIFANQEKTGLDTAPVFTYWQVDIPADSKVERVLNYLPDDKGQRNPAITAHNLGSGRVVFCSTSADWQWTFLPAKPAYVALVHELLSGNVTSGDRWLNKLVGEQLEIPPTVQLTGIPSMKDPQQADVILEQSTVNNRPVYRSRPLDKPGIYTLTTGNRTIPVAVNVPDDEADIRPMDGSAIKKALGDIEISMLDDQLPAEAASQISGNDFGWSFMLIVLTLVGLECFMAMKFGHYRR